MDKVTRPVRNRRHSRRSWPPTSNLLEAPSLAAYAGSCKRTQQQQHHHQQRLQKRLFTPEIKRMLKDWLVRRRDNPYPSRDEKKALAVGSGLTYIQICNWFANWRRKLKNAGQEPAKRTWGNLIKNYNTSANGNVEQFSISSNDSIWNDDGAEKQQKQPKKSHSQQYPNEMCAQLTTTPPQFHHPDYRSSLPSPCVRFDPIADAQTMEYYDNFGELVVHTMRPPDTTAVACSTVRNGDAYLYGYFSDEATTANSSTAQAQEQCFQISSTTTPLRNTDNIELAVKDVVVASNSKPVPNVKYKSNIMEKYLRDLRPDRGSDGVDDGADVETERGGELSKWLESAANFTPDKKNYIEWVGCASASGRSKVHQTPSHLRTTSECHSEHSTTTTLKHEREELEAAEALTSLAGNFRNRMFGMLRH